MVYIPPIKTVMNDDEWGMVYYTHMKIQGMVIFIGIQWYIMKYYEHVLYIVLKICV